MAMIGASASAELQALAALTRCRERISYLRHLHEGWHDGFGHPPTSESEAAALRLLSRNPGMAASYSIFPTDAGGLLFEFVHSGWNYSVEIGPGGTAEMHGTEIEGDAEMAVGQAGSAYGPPASAASAGLLDTPPPSAAAFAALTRRVAELEALVGMVRGLG